MKTRISSAIVSPGGADLVVWQEMTRGWTVSFRSDTFAGDLVVGTICLNVGANPLPVFLAPLRRQAVCKNSDPKDFGKTESPVIDEFGRPDQCVDQLFPLAGIFACKEFTHPLGRRQRSGEVETDTAEKLRIARRF